MRERKRNIKTLHNCISRLYFINMLDTSKKNEKELERKFPNMVLKYLGRFV